jgi:cell division protein FtsW
MKTTATLLLVFVLVLLTLGAVALCTCDLDSASGPGFFGKQLYWMQFGFVALVCAALIDYRWLKKWGLPYLLLGVCVVLLALVWHPGVGVCKNGAYRWLKWGQPSEAAKLGVILWLAAYCAHSGQRLAGLRIGFLVPGGVVGLVAGLIFLEPDWGTATLLIVVCGCMLLHAGARWKYMLTTAASFVAFLALAIWFNPLRYERVLAFLNPEDYRLTVAMQPWQTMLALARGSWRGVGAGQGIHSLGYIPAQESDFILSAIGEEWGLVGTGLLWAGSLGFFQCGMFIARRAADDFGRLLVTGISYLVGLQTLLNLAVATSLLPNKGISLPFVSYGGSNLIVMMAAVGLMISVARHSPQTTSAAASTPPPRPQPPCPGNPFTGGSLPSPRPV